MLKWNEYEAIEFFEVLANFDDARRSHSFEVAKDGLRLLVTVFDIEEAVSVSIFRDGINDPLFTIRRENCTIAQVTKDERFRQCFEAGPPKHGVRVYVKPHFQVALLEDRCDLAK